MVSQEGGRSARAELDVYDEGQINGSGKMGVGAVSIHDRYGAGAAAATGDPAQQNYTQPISGKLKRLSDSATVLCDLGYLKYFRNNGVLGLWDPKHPKLFLITVGVPRFDETYRTR